MVIKNSGKGAKQFLLLNNRYQDSRKTLQMLFMNATAVFSHVNCAARFIPSFFF
jgi:hypothetical protein